jgi:hypothetical protein
MIAGTIMCFLLFNILILKAFNLEAFIKVTVAAFIMGPIVGYLSYKGSGSKQKSPK